MKTPVSRLELKETGVDLIGWRDPDQEKSDL